MLLLVASGGASAQQQLDNVIIQWQNLTQDAVRTFGIPNQVSVAESRLMGYANVQLEAQVHADACNSEC